MEWIKLPDDFHNGRTYFPLATQFLAIWKGQICLVDYDEEMDRFILCMLPSQYPGVMIVSRERECKFTHFCELKRP